LKDKSNHGKALPKNKLDAAFSDLDDMRKKLGIDGKVDAKDFVPTPPKSATPSVGNKTKGQLPDPDFATLLKEDAKFESSGKLATRRAYGLALRELAKLDDRIVALDADVSNSTFANFLGKEQPDRFVECKIAEQNMVSAAAGFSAAGYMPFVSSFGKFLVRAYDQIEMAMNSRANIKLAGSHIGVTLAADGPSQMGLCDVAFFRSLGTPEENGEPTMVVFNPADAVCAWKCV